MFLDEVGELSASNQRPIAPAHSLKRSVTRLGSNRPVPVDVRVLSATNRDLSAEIGWRRFRSDLYYRLDGATIELPPLRSRMLDLLPMIERFVAECGGKVTVSRATLSALRGHHWPGNVRELRNAIEHAMAVHEGDVIEPHDLPASIRGAGPSQGDKVTLPLRARVAGIERLTIESALARSHGNQSEAARILGITRRALIYRMELHGVDARSRGSRGDRRGPEGSSRDCYQ